MGDKLPSYSCTGGNLMKLDENILLKTIYTCLYVDIQYTIENNKEITFICYSRIWT